MNTQRLKLEFAQRITYGALALFVATFSFPTIVSAEGETNTETPDTTQTSTPETPPSTPETPPETTSETTPEPTVAETPPPPPPVNTQGPQSPTGAERDTYAYNEATGLWENSKYTWDPVTKQTSPKSAPTYSYNPSTGHWDTTEWIYDAPSGTYVPNIISTIAPPDGAVLDTSEGTPPPSSEAARALDGSPSRLSSLSSPYQDGLSENNVKDDSSTKGAFDLFYNVLISNNITSSAITGDALVSMNTLAGNALSGDASSIATVFNLMQSIWNLGITGNAFTTFTQNIFGSLIGDLWLQTPTAGTAVQSNTDNDIDINASQNAAIHNTIDLEAISGDADVTKNTTAGNATTGSATVIANIINAINSSIVSGNSFLGMLNIYGSLDGDILLPQELISTLLASNAIGNLNTSSINNTEIIGEFNNTLSTQNNVNASATSGDATVTHNTTAGNATTGDAQTNVTLLNLTGRQVVGKNTLLVFVNVLGTWVGMLVDAPQGSTSSAYGSGITNDTSLAITENTDQAIINDINVRAKSGDATVASNTTAGNATTGDAYAAVNILNLNNSQFALSDWFGVLFINVFGSWNGSFGIDTAAGTLPQLASAAGVGDSSAPQSSPSTLGVSAKSVKAFAFQPNSDGTYTLAPSDDGVTALASANVLSTTDSTPKQKNKPTLADSMKNTDWTLMTLGMTLGVGLLGAERYYSRKSTK